MVSFIVFLSFVSWLQSFLSVSLWILCKQFWNLWSLRAFCLGLNFFYYANDCRLTSCIPAKPRSSQKCKDYVSLVSLDAVCLPLLALWPFQNSQEAWIRHGRHVIPPVFCITPSLSCIYMWHWGLNPGPLHFPYAQAIFIYLLLLWDKVLLNCLAWASTCDLPAFVSHNAGITDLCALFHTFHLFISLSCTLDVSLRVSMWVIISLFWRHLRLSDMFTSMAIILFAVFVWF